MPDLLAISSISWDVDNLELSFCVSDVFLLSKHDNYVLIQSLLYGFWYFSLLSFGGK